MVTNDAFEVVDKALKASYAAAPSEQKELLADARNAMADLKAAFSQLQADVRSLNDKLVMRDKLDKEPGHDWLMIHGDAHPAYRYCPVCYYDDQKLIPLSDPISGIWFHGQRTCPICKGNIS